MKEKTQIEKIIDAIEAKDKLKSSNVSIIKENKKEEWDKEVEESPYNDYYGVDIKCAVVLMNAIEKGLEAKEAVYISEHRYKVPAFRTRNLLHRYSTESEEICEGIDEVIEEQRKGFNKKLVYKRREQFKDSIKKRH